MKLRIEDWASGTWIQVDYEPVRTITLYIDFQPVGEYQTIDDAFDILIETCIDFNPLHA